MKCNEILQVDKFILEVSPFFKFFFFKYLLKKGETSSSKLSTCNQMLQVDNLLLEVSLFFFTFFYLHVDI